MPEAERLVSESPPCRPLAAWRLCMGVQTTQMRDDFLQMHESVVELLALGSRIRRSALTRLHDLVHGNFLMLHLMPEPAQRRQRLRRGVEGPADAPLP